jgi:hypothetical protein
MFAFVDLSRCVIYDGAQLTRNRRSVGKKQHSPVFIVYFGKVGTNKNN